MLFVTFAVVRNKMGTERLLGMPVVVSYKVKGIAEWPA